MARALVIKVNPYMHNESLEEIRQEVLRQYNAGGVIVISKFYEVTEVEFDSVRAEELGVCQMDAELGECQPDTEQPKRVKHENGYYLCPECGFKMHFYNEYRICPYCKNSLKW